MKVKALSSIGTLMILLLTACVKDKNFDPPASNCVSDLVSNASFTQVKALYQDKTLQIQDDLMIEGYVVSSDEASNFFNVLHIQNKPSEPTEGFQIEIDVRDSHLFYPVGSKVFIKLKGLFLGESKGVYKLGGVFTSFGNLSIGRLPAAIVDAHLFVSCEEINSIQPTITSVEKLNELPTNTLVQITSLEVSESELGEVFAIKGEETERLLVDCDDYELKLVTSGFSDFQSELLPDGKGRVTGVLQQERDDYFLAIRSIDDIDFSNERCIELVSEFSSERIIISELADPNNNLKARFVELYNSSNEALSLNGWTLQRYTNANVEVNSTIDLSELSIAALGTIVIAGNAQEFENAYGLLPDLEAPGNSAANSNGDDNIVLVDPFGKVIDIFGIIGEDGTGTNHEFEDGRALRKTNISSGNAEFTFNEWNIYNDSGNSGTTNTPQNAPEDFTPGSRN